MKVRMAAGAMLLFSSGCTVGVGCELDECENDYECESNEICEARLLSGKQCETAEVCLNENGCPSDKSCVQRGAQQPTNPFQSAEPNKSVCECKEGFSCYDYGDYGGAGGSGGAGGAGGAGGYSGFYQIGAPTEGSSASDSPGNTEGPRPAAPVLGAQGARVIALSFEGALELPGAPLVSAGDHDIGVMATTCAGQLPWALGPLASAAGGPPWCGVGLEDRSES